MRSHPGGSVLQRFLQCVAGPRVDILLGEGLLGRRHLGNGFVERALLAIASAKQARLVEMNVGFDQSRRDEPAGQILRRCICFGKPGLDRNETAAVNADIDRTILATSDPCVSKNEIERHDAFLFVAWAIPAWPIAEKGRKAYSARLSGSPSEV
jgi:hypothetical protein